MKQPIALGPPPVLSIVVPVYNEGEMIDLFFDTILPILDQLGESFELICVSDGSRDDSFERVIARSERDPRVRGIELSRNFGKERALSAGLDWSRGAAVIPIDVDLQDPPELIAVFVERWREGYEVVYGTRQSRHDDSVTKRVTAGLFYWVFNTLSNDVLLPPNAGDYRLMDRRVVDAVCAMPERSRFMKGIFAWVGFRSVSVPFERKARAAGQTKFNYLKLWRFALDGITAFSTLPLRLWSYLGVFFALIAFVYSFAIVARTVLSGVDVPGYASTFVAVLLIGGVQLISLGVLGEYIGRLFEEVKARPIYLVRQSVGYGDSEGAKIGQAGLQRGSTSAP